MTAGGLRTLYTFRGFCNGWSLSYSYVMTAVVRPLADVAADVASGAVTAEGLHEAFLASTVYCERGDRPGFRALGSSAGGGVVPVYSSVEQLALARGTVDWFALTGRDLLTELPAGYDVLLDMGGATPLRLRTGALRRQVVIEVRTAEVSGTGGS